MNASRRASQAAVVAAALLILAGGIAPAAPRPGLPTPAGVRAGCVCHAVCVCKNLLLDGVHLGHRYLRDVVHLVVERARQAADGARDASGGGSPGRRTAP